MLFGPEVPEGKDGTAVVAREGEEVHELPLGFP
jgi:hypothetical protein